MASAEAESTVRNARETEAIAGALHAPLPTTESEAWSSVIMKRALLRWQALLGYLAGMLALLYKPFDAAGLPMRRRSDGLRGAGL